MNIVVFLGPTLPVREARRVLNADYRGPAAQGDVLKALQGGGKVICVIDGYFERMPAVWHKEILWAMAEGAHVFGAASMGALRAAELDEFGMIGIGAIFESYRSGDLDADDEVAVTHAAAEDGFRCLSEAMVNVRVTLRAAVAEGIIEELTRARLEQLMKAEFYPDRTYSLLLEKGRRDGLADSQLVALRNWLPRGRVDQKRLDALKALNTIRRFTELEVVPKRVQYKFEHTDAWEFALRASAIPHGANGSGADLSGPESNQRN